ncbi:DUF1152 domain-containing protein [Kitasatospora sp. NPDC058046]|uniref:DUF1152 domain-containing protein n=1 Tax=Kitasatospora sp. NPDC058046 TaxID=3346312 RepID=UPI0036DC3AEF
MSRLLVACGGSGDLVTALAVAASPPRDQSEPASERAANRVAVLAAPVWERFALDPRPGPRGPADLTGLSSLPAGRRITVDTRLPGGYSPLPALAGMLRVPIIYLSFADGAVGLRSQLERIVRCYGITTVELVDTGGDALARGHEPGLVSPASDALLLAAVAPLGCRTLLTCAGLGIDGELTPAELDALTTDIPAESVRELAVEQAAALYREFSWMPSEASLITLLAAGGLQGTVDLSEGRPLVRVDGGTARAHSFPLRPVATRSRHAAAVAATTSFAEADRRLRAAGARSEYQAELDRAAAVATGRVAKIPADLGRLVERARPRGDYLSVRRIARASGLNSRQGHLWLERLLRHSAGADYRRPLLRVTPAVPVPHVQEEEAT